jgi:hypothetical protein
MRSDLKSSRRPHNCQEAAVTVGIFDANLIGNAAENLVL